MSVTFGHLPPLDPNFIIEPNAPHITILNEDAFTLCDPDGKPSDWKWFMHASTPLLIRIAAIIQPFLPISVACYSLSSLAPHIFSSIQIGAKTVVTLLALFVACVAVKKMFEHQLSRKKLLDYDQYLITQAEKYRYSVHSHGPFTAWQFAMQPTFQQKYPATYAELESQYQNYLLRRAIFFKNDQNNLDVATQYTRRLKDPETCQMLFRLLSSKYDFRLIKGIRRSIKERDPLSMLYKSACQIHNDYSHDDTIYEIAWADFKFHARDQDREVRKRTAKNIAQAEGYFRYKKKYEELLIEVNCYLSAFQRSANFLKHIPDIDLSFRCDILSGRHDIDTWINEVIIDDFERYLDFQGLVRLNFEAIVDTIMLLQNHEQRVAHLKTLATLCRDSSLETQAQIAEYCASSSSSEYEHALSMEKWLRNLNYKEVACPVPALGGCDIAQHCVSMQSSPSQIGQMIQEKLTALEASSNQELCDADTLVKSHYENVLQYCHYLNALPPEALELFAQKAAANPSFAVRAYYYAYYYATCKAS